MEKTMREKLIEILRVPIYLHELADHTEAVADYLLDNGVTIATDNNVGHKWIPVSERFPGKAASYLCRCIVNDFDDMPFYMVLSYILYDKNPHFQHETKGGMKVTHWMPLPQPPKEG